MDRHLDYCGSCICSGMDNPLGSKHSANPLKEMGLVLDILHPSGNGYGVLPTLAAPVTAVRSK